VPTPGKLASMETLTASSTNEAEVVEVKQQPPDPDETYIKKVKLQLSVLNLP
jgi:hypothetical protein